MSDTKRTPIRKVLVLFDEPEPFQARLTGRFPDVAFTWVTRLEDVDPALEAARPDAVFTMKHSGFLSPAHRSAARFETVRWCHSGGAGYDHLLPLEPGRPVLTNGRGVLAPFLAETVIGAMLALNGGLLRYISQQQRKIWQARPFRPLAGQTLLILGLGAIGSEVGRRAKALGLRVLATRPRAEAHPSADEVHAPERLMQLLPQADIVSLHVRLDQGTRHMIGAEVLAAMRPGAILINAARGAVVDEAALVAALQSGHLGGAYLDVFETEPLPASSPLWGLENVLLTPHNSDGVADWPERFAALFADNLARWNSGEPLVNEVDLRR